MQCTISACFTSPDEADRAIARLRRAVPFLRAEDRVPTGSSLPADAPFSASIYFPWRISMTVNDRGSMNTELGSRVLYTSDRLGLPIYHSGETEVHLMVDAQDAERVRALLVNLGGRSIRTT